MSVNVSINLPGNVYVRDVAKVAGILAGLKPAWEPLPGKGDGRYVTVPGAEVLPTPTVGLAEIKLASPAGRLADGFKDHAVDYHFEPSYSGGRLLMPLRTAFWMAMGKGLIDFFGGSMTDDDGDVLYRKKANPRRVSNPSDGADYDRFQERIMAVKKLTKADLAHWAGQAAY